MNVLCGPFLRECTSCQVCASVCGKHAISIELDSDGFYRPVINQKLCTNCGLCTTVCYRFDNSIRITSEQDLSDKRLYSAWVDDEEILANTTSGGIGDLLARELYLLGYHVVGVIYNNDKGIAEHRIAKTDKDLNGFRGSKYIQSFSFNAFKEMVSNCDGERYAVFGTPCQIYALNRLAEKRNKRSNFIFIDLYCHGCPSMLVWKKYLAAIQSKYGQDRISGVSFRSKVKGWGKFCVSFVSKGSILYSSSVKDNSFYDLFFSDALLNKACYDCSLRSTLEYTDIRLGDFWGKKYLWNKKGVSGVSIATECGKSLFDRIKTRVIYQECAYSDFLPYQSWGHVYQDDSVKRLALLTVLQKQDSTISDIDKEYRKLQNWKERCLRVIKVVLSYLPDWITTLFKMVR